LERSDEGREVRSGANWDLGSPEREVRFALINGHRQYGAAYKGQSRYSAM